MKDAIEALKAFKARLLDDGKIVQAATVQSCITILRRFA